MAWSDRNVFLEARALRHDLGLTPADVADPFAISEGRNIDVVRVPLGANEPIEGAFLRRAGREFIFVNGSKAGRRQRFTVAHELGHALLIPDEDEVELLDTADQLDTATDFREREASLFADELLMPLAGLQAIIAEGIAPENAVGIVCRTYNVSPISAATRLKIAGILDQSTLEKLRATFDQDWQRFWREQDIPRDDPGPQQVLVPGRFSDLAARLLKAGVISSERHEELVRRDPPSLA